MQNEIIINKIRDTLIAAGTTFRPDKIEATKELLKLKRTLRLNGF